MSCLTFFAPFTVTKYCGDPSDPLLHILLWCCATAATPLWLMLWCWCCDVAAAVYRVITLPAMPGHAPAVRWTYTQLWRMSQQSQHQTRSSCYILCMPGIRIYVMKMLEHWVIQHCHWDILWMCPRPGRGATPFPSIIISNDQKINRNSPSYKKHGMGLHLNKWKLSVSKMYMTWNGIFQNVCSTLMSRKSSWKLKLIRKIKENTRPELWLVWHS